MERVLYLLLLFVSGALSHSDLADLHGIVPNKEGLEHQLKHTHDPYIHVDKLSNDEKIMEYFNMFDVDQNGYVDGLESTKKMLELQLEHQTFTPEELSKHLSFDGETFKAVLQVIDDQFSRTDTNKDGYISFMEYKAATYF
eukprot:TRINITY_DN3078_c0_g1_i1.p1 TRINITY_DN3078_c0_g1~~TRINITY_DN3078_c0_g1_i1.p1  ORF type:complete len:141 (-),score=17.76 TRINITY_DN3078_c0_g1_i1:111-533(-)